METTKVMWAVLTQDRHKQAVVESVHFTENGALMAHEKLIHDDGIEDWDGIRDSYWDWATEVWYWVERVDVYN